MTWVQWFSVGSLAFTVLALSLAAYWLRGTALNYRAAAAYRQGDMAGGDALRRRAKRWSVGVRS